MATGPVFMFCASGLIFGGTECVGSRFHVLRSRTHFRRYGGRQVPFSCFARPNSFSTVSRVSGPVFVFCAPGVISRVTEGVGSRFHVLRSLTRFRLFQGRRVPFSSFVRPESLSSVPRASGHIFMFCAGTSFWRYRVRLVPFSCLALPDTFSAIRRSSGPVFLFCAHKLILAETRVPFSFSALPESFLAVPGASGPVFIFCAPGLIFGGTAGIRSRFHVLRSWTWFRRGRGRRVQFSCFVCPDSFSAVSRATGPVVMFCALGLIFGGTEGARSRFR
jgi:hypothetical protein